jgi:hypothetical protein
VEESPPNTTEEPSCGVARVAEEISTSETGNRFREAKRMIRAMKEIAYDLVCGEKKSSAKKENPETKAGRGRQFEWNI